MLTIIKIVLVALVFMAWPNQCKADTQVTNSWKVYSPTFITQNGQLVMYYGGWDTTDQANWNNTKNTANPIYPQDKIYRSVCSSRTSCSPGQIVIDPRWYGLGLINDPSVITMNIPGKRPYLIMYMTVVACTTPGCGNYTPNNATYYSVSWADDGVHWSPPQPLASDIFTPSATIDAWGNVLLYGQSTIWGDARIRVYNMGPSGVTPQSENLITAGGNSIVGFNPNVTNFTQYGYSQMFFNNNNTIYYYYSFDPHGTLWYYWGAVPGATASGITSPANYPSTYCWMYYGKPNNSNDTINIYFQPWC